MNQDVFRDQVVIVTGASYGIGRSLSLLLADQKAKVALTARQAERLESVAAECHLPRSLSKTSLAQQGLWRESFTGLIAWRTEIKFNKEKSLLRPSRTLARPRSSRVSPLSSLVKWASRLWLVAAMPPCC